MLDYFIIVAEIIGFSVFVILACVGLMFVIRAWTFAIELSVSEYKFKKLKEASKDVSDEYLKKVQDEFLESEKK
jgi:hypothetical protein